MRFSVFLMFMCSTFLSFGQASKIALPTIIPPSPEVAQLSNVGKPSVGLHTGSANVSVPLYSFSVNSAAVQLSLNYNSNGIKVDEIPGRVGLGWNLLTGGMVSRTIHGEPDGEMPFVAPPTNLFQKNATLLNYLKQVTSPLGGYDTEWDEYSYSFNGISGKFFLDDNGNGYCIPHNNFKVKVYGHNTSSKYVEIITGDGVKYEFGLYTREKTSTINIGGGPQGSVTKVAAYETAWFLEKIITPEGGTIMYSYAPLHTKAFTGKYQTMIKPIVGAYACAAGDCGYSESSGINAIEYDTQVLTQIVADNVNVSLSYEDRPDGSGDKRITALQVYSEGVAIKHFKFDYYTPSFNNATFNKRFFLTRVRQIEPGSSPERSIDYEFTYDDIDGMPERMSYSQDWFGYNNGVLNSYLAPYIPSLHNTVVGGAYGANRNPGTLGDMQKGVLKTVKYPTGGIETFNYEPHTISQYVGTPVSSYVSAGGSGLGVYSPWVHTSSVFTANADQQVTIFLNCYKSPAFPDAPSGEGSKIYEVKVKKVSNNEIVYTRKYFNYMSESYTVSLLNNVQYNIELTIWGDVNAGSATILHYNVSTNYAYENKIAGGIRVKSISSYDPVSLKINNRYYTYAKYPDFSKSSGVGPLYTINSAPYQTGIICTTGQPPEVKVNRNELFYNESNLSRLLNYEGSPDAVSYSSNGESSNEVSQNSSTQQTPVKNEDLIFSNTMTCSNYMISSNSLSPYYTFAGSNVGYTSVIESDDPEFANGFTQHEFHTSYPSTSIPYIILGTAPLNTPIYLDTDLNGSELKTNSYKKNATGGYILLKKVENEYALSDAVLNTRVSLIARRRFEFLPSYTPTAEIEFSGFDLVQYYYTGRWVQQLSSKVTEFDEKGENPMVTLTNTVYANATHLQPTETNVKGSDDILKKTQYKYPVDFAVASPINVYHKMLNQNRVAVPIETSVFKGTNLLETVNTTYMDWNNDGKIIYPDMVQTKFKNAAVWENRLQYAGYDSKGNVLEVSKVNDMKEAYIWGYGKKYPIAKVSNAVTGQVAYTSFEEGDKGYWSYNGQPYADPTSYTGSKVYHLLSGIISRTVSVAGTYIVSYWSKSSAAVLLVTPVSTVSKPGPNGWTYYEHKISVTAGASIQVSGAVVLDELRMYPDGALMNTLTYIPHIGVTNETNATNETLKYSYDTYGRLVNVRDKAGNILKQNQYVYNETVPYSLSTAVNWVATGVIRCRRVAPNNNFDGQQEMEERDMNSSSPTYLQYRYTAIGASSNCTPIPNCTGVDKRVIGSNCVTGNKIFVSSNFYNGQWNCVYYYKWTDGYRTPDYIGANSASCIGDPE